MADEEDYDGDIFIYRGGRAPRYIDHARIDKSLDEIEDYAFCDCEYLIQVDTHDGLRKIGKDAFRYCRYLPQINLKSVVEIDSYAFDGCENLADVEFGDRLETIRNSAFRKCALKHLKLPTIINIGAAFRACTYLSDIELSERLQAIGVHAFNRCDRLKRIAMPLKRDLFVFDSIWESYTQFFGCDQLTIVDIVGAEGIHKTVASLHMESWRTEMIAEINRINQVLPTTPADGKTFEIRQWMHSVLDKMDHYKAEHNRYVKEGITLLELALWKAKLGEQEETSVDSAEGKTKKAKVDAESTRKRKRITCGADMVIKNVLPFLQLD